MKWTTCVAIPTYNREEILVKTLGSVLEMDPPPDEILIVDQTLEHEKNTEQFLESAQQKGRVRLIRQQPPSLTAARNRAVMEAKSDILIFIDDDVELPKDFVLTHLRNYGDDRVQAVAGKVRQENQPRYPEPPRGGNGRGSWTINISPCTANKGRKTSRLSWVATTRQERQS